jgi:hypothetical protein
LAHRFSAIQLFCNYSIQSPGWEGLVTSGSHPQTPPLSMGLDTPETLTRGGGEAGAPITAIPDRFKDSLEELFRKQHPGHVRSCLLKDVRKLCGYQEQLTKAH